MARAYPAHISLKQPCEIGDRLEDMEAYMARLAASIPPLPIELRGLYVWRTCWVLTYARYRHCARCTTVSTAKLPPIFGDVRADFDGDGYHFHMTVAMGGVSAETYKAIFAACNDIVLPRAFTARELGLFTGYQKNDGGWQYMLHTVQPLAE